MRLGIGFLMIWMFLTACQKKKTETTAPSITTDAAPIIKNLPINIEPYDPGTQKAGDMDFTLSTLGTTNKWFVEFGGNYTWNGNGPQSVVSRHFYIKMPSGKPVYSMIDGVVRSASLNDNHPDYEVRLSPRTGSYWVVSYDHLENITVAAGDTVVAGQQIGVTSTVNTADLEVDISLNGDPSTYFCLSDFFDPSVSTSLRTKLAQLMTDIETVKGDATLYNQAGHHNIACVLESYQSE